MKIAVHNPAATVKPASRYAQAVTVRDASHWLLVSGQVGVAPDGSVEDGARNQTRRCFANILATLADAGMGRENLVKITAFLTRAEDVAVFREERDRVLEGHLCASTLLVVSALAHPQFLVEIEAVAAA